MFNHFNTNKWIIDLKNWTKYTLLKNNNLLNDIFYHCKTILVDYRTYLFIIYKFNLFLKCFLKFILNIIDFSNPSNYSSNFSNYCVQHTQSKRKVNNSRFVIHFGWSLFQSIRRLIKNQLDGCDLKVSRTAKYFLRNFNYFQL